MRKFNIGDKVIVFVTKSGNGSMYSGTIMEKTWYERSNDMYAVHIDVDNQLYDKYIGGVLYVPEQFLLPYNANVNEFDIGDLVVVYGETIYKDNVRYLGHICTAPDVKEGLNVLYGIKPIKKDVCFMYEDNVVYANKSNITLVEHQNNTTIVKIKTIETHNVNDLLI